MASIHEEYLSGTPDEVVRQVGERYERHFVPAIGYPATLPLIDAAQLRAGERVLDVGCGTGVAARIAAERVGPSGAVTGVDPTPPMLQAAQRTAPELDWRQGPAEDLPVDDESFDAAVAANSYQFFADRDQALREMHRALTPGGRVALGTPGPTPPMMAALEGVLADHIGPPAATFVRKVFSVHDPDEVASALDRAGFTDVEARTMTLPLRLPPPEHFFWQYVTGTPLVVMASALDDDARTAMERDVVERTRPFVDGDALTMEPDLLVATARR